MFVENINENQGQISTGTGKEQTEQTRFEGFFAYLLDICTEHMVFSALLQDGLIVNLLAWEGRTADRGFKNMLSNGYLGWWCS